MRRLHKRSGASVPHAIVLLALLMVVVYLYVNRRRNLPAPADRPGWLTYGTVVNTYDIRIDRAYPHQVWYATSGGLKRYDRRTGYWDTWGAERGLTGGQVSSLTGNGGDTLWLSTWYGVAALDKRTDSLYALPLPPTILAKRIFRVTDDGGYLWIGTDGRGIYRYRKKDGSTEKFTDKDGMAENSVYAFYAGDTAVWAGGAGAGLSRFSRSNGRWKRLDVPDDATVVTKIWAIAPQGGFLWMATSDAGIWRYRLEDGSWRVYKKGSGMLADGTYTLLVDGDDIWVGTHYCLMRYSTKADAWLNIVKPGEREFMDVTALDADGDDLWYGTFRKGIGRMDKKSIRWQDVPDGLTANSVEALCSVGDTLLVGFGYDEGCMDRFNRRTLTWQGNVNRYEGMDGLQVECISTTGRYVFAGTWAGLYVKIRGGAGGWKHYASASGLPDDDVTCLTPGIGGMWVGTGRGLAFFDSEHQTIDADSRLSDTRITALTVDSAGGIWAGMYGGQVSHFDVDAENTVRYFEDNSDEVTSLAFLRGRLWAGTMGGGIIEFDPVTGTTVRHTSKSALFDRLSPGLPHNRVNAIVSPRPGVLWAATDAGIGVYGGEARWSRITEYDGLYDNEVTTLSVDSEYVWAGHYGGITRIERAQAFPYGNGGRDTAAE